MSTGFRKKCHQMKETKKNHNQEYTISSLIKKEFILVEKEVMSKEEILKKGCDLLYKNEYVKQGFYEDVLKKRRNQCLRSRRRGCTATRNGESGNKTSSCYHEMCTKN
ncbi:MAG: PTS sugar transporter subunit IIA [Anaerostipes hadrus]